MKVITIHQSWATLIALGEKRFETRGWATKYRGPIAIHASKKDPRLMMRSLPHDISTNAFDRLYTKLGVKSGALARLATGSVIATANLTECYKVHIDHSGDAVLMVGNVPKVWIGEGSNEYEFGWYEEGRYAWELTNVKLLDKPIPAKGQQGLWNWGGLRDE